MVISRSSLLLLLIDVSHQVLPRGEPADEVDGMQNALATIMTVVLFLILIATLIAMWKHR